MECVGRVEALGPDTDGPAVGERVVTVAVPAVPGPHVAGTWQAINVKVIPQLMETPNGPVLPSASDQALFADNTPSNGSDLVRHSSNCTRTSPDRRIRACPKQPARS